MATKAFKNEKIEAFKESFSKAKVAVVTDYRGLTVAQITKLRRELQKESGDYTVTKNTLAKVALEGTEYAGIAELMKGPSAIAFGFEDQVSPAKILVKFIKETKKGEIKGAFLDGKLLSAEEVLELAKLPSKEELLAKMLGCINSPATGLVMTTSGVATALVRAMDAVREKKGAA